MNNTAVTLIEAWECIGCGRIEAPQPCLGVCQDRAVALVPADAYRAVAAERDNLAADNAAMRGLLLRLAGTTPRGNQWEASYRAIQARAQALLAGKKRPGPNLDRPVR